jgi:hypothetical protein
VFAWFELLNLFSEIGSNLPVWNGYPPPDDAVYNRPTGWDPSLLTLISVVSGAAEYDQCTMSRGSRWLVSF